ncbi:hypothetical protein BH11CYA1_BH11CYA1_08080 [soil metagenome]
MSKDEEFDRPRTRSRARLLQQLQTVIVDPDGHERPYLEQYFDCELPDHARAYIYELVEVHAEEGEVGQKVYQVVQLAGTVIFRRGVVH